MKYCFVFICQQGELEIKSVLLAASLKRYTSHECIAAIPQPWERWGSPSAETLDFLAQLGVRTVFIENKINDDYPIGNKVSCLGISTNADKLIFLDSDILCLRPFSGDKRFSDFDFNAKPADLATYSDWSPVYETFNLNLPERRVLSTVSGELMLPYFNAGFIAVSSKIAFAETWGNVCRTIDANPKVTQKRPWLDQIALPITVEQLNMSSDCLDERFNFPAHLKPLSSELPFFCHYHTPDVIRREPVLNSLVQNLAQTYPFINTLLNSRPEWANLLKPYTLKNTESHHSFLSNLGKIPQLFSHVKKSEVSQPHPEVIITGIPRSGTSYLCRLLHTLENSVVINEPAEIFNPLINQKTPWQVAVFHRELRRRILDGIPIENKIHEGQLIEDTAVIDVRNSYLPEVTRPDFLLSTKNTLAYLARIDQLRRVMPDAPIITCVRNPIDTIASWKSSFVHLQQAKVTEFPVGHVNDPFLAGWQRQYLLEIAECNDAALKRALLWRYLAECILVQREKLILVPYENLVQQPLEYVKNILKRTSTKIPLQFKEPVVSSIPRQKRQILDSLDKQAIGDICGQHALELGYELTL